MLESLVQYFKKSGQETADTAPDGYCPNCWGTQRYDNVVREMYKDKQIDVNNDKANYTFIRDFVVKRIDGIHLIKGDNGYECPTCKVIYDKEN